MLRFFIYLVPFLVFEFSHAMENIANEITVDPSSGKKSSVLLVQDQSQNKQMQSSSSLYIQCNTSGLFPSLGDWKNQFHLSDGTRPSVSCIAFGAEAGWLANKYIQVSVGYEFFFTTKVATLEATGDQVNSTFLYGSIRACMPLESVQNLSLIGGVDVGSLSATEVMENYFGLNINKTGSTTAYRFMLGAQYFLIDNWSVIAGTGYLFGKVNNVKVDGQTWHNFSLDLSGFILRFAVNYHFPLSS